jgi:peptidase M28-like protein
MTLWGMKCKSLAAGSDPSIRDAMSAGSSDPAYPLGVGMSPMRLAASLLLSFSLVASSGAQAPAVRSSTVIDSAQLLRDLRTLAADEMEGRRVDTPGGAKARAYVVQRFRESGVVPFGTSYEVPFTFAGGRGAAGDRHGVNVIGHIEGTRQPRRYIVISAHYDHVGVRGTEVFNGADDNASGTAALFALARYFSAHKPAHSLIFAAFDGEEAGLRGAQAFVREPPVDASALVVDLNMDMIGRDPADKLFVVGTFLQPELKPYIEAVQPKAPVKLIIGHDNPNERGVEDWTKQSDHYAFITAKIPALYFGVEDFGQHHKSTDDYDTMTFDFYIRAVETMVLVVQEFDSGR